jgi:hypothetical protein
LTSQRSGGKGAGFSGNALESGVQCACSIVPELARATRFGSGLLPCAANFRCHHPRKRVIKYSRGLSFEHSRLWNIGRIQAVKPGDDTVSDHESYFCGPDSDISRSARNTLL